MCLKIRFSNVALSKNKKGNFLKFDYDSSTLTSISEQINLFRIKAGALNKLRENSLLFLINFYFK